MRRSIEHDPRQACFALNPSLFRAPHHPSIIDVGSLALPLVLVAFRCFPRGEQRLLLHSTCISVEHFQDSVYLGEPAMLW